LDRHASSAASLLDKISKDGRVAGFALLLLLAQFAAISYIYISKPRDIFMDTSFFFAPAYNLAKYGVLTNSLRPDLTGFGSNTYWMPPLDFFLQSLLYRVFDPADTALRLVVPAILPVILSLLGLWLLLEFLMKLKPSGEVSKLLLIAAILSPGFVYTAITNRPEALMGLIAIGMLVTASPLLLGLLCAMAISTHFAAALLVIYAAAKSYKSKTLPVMLLSCCVFLLPYLWFMSLDPSGALTQILHNALSSGVKKEYLPTLFGLFKFFPIIVPTLFYGWKELKSRKIPGLEFLFGVFVFIATVPIGAESKYAIMAVPFLLYWIMKNHDSQEVRAYLVAIIALNLAFNSIALGQEALSTGNPSDIVKISASLPAGTCYSFEYFYMLGDKVNYFQNEMVPPNGYTYNACKYVVAMKGFVPAQVPCLKEQKTLIETRSFLFARLGFADRSTVLYENQCQGLPE
jgi:hypothetical protein